MACVGNLVRPTTVFRQFITLSVHLCVQHKQHDTARRAGSYATAETYTYQTDACNSLRWEIAALFGLFMAKWNVRIGLFKFEMSICKVDKYAEFSV